MNLFLCNSYFILVHYIVLKPNASSYSVIDVKLEEPMYGTARFTVLVCALQFTNAMFVHI